MIREYQLTPLRTEGDYEDFRHPWEIQWSSDILLDFQRRDLSINAMYYFSVDKKSKAPLDFQKEGSLIDAHELWKILEKEGYCYLGDLNLLILQKLEYLDQVFHQAHFDEDYFRYLIETQKNACFRNQESFNDQPQKFRVLLDPAKGIQSFIHKKIETVRWGLLEHWESWISAIKNSLPSKNMSKK